MGKTYADLLKEKAQKVEAETKKKLSKDTVIYATAKSHDYTNADREAVSTFFKALATRDPEDLAKSNHMQVKGYEAKGLDWRTDSEYKIKAQSVGTVGSGSSGGVLVPTMLREQILEKLYYISPIRQIATVVNNMPASWDVPFDNALPTTAWVSEGAAISDSGATFSKKTLQPSKLAGLDSFTSESLMDTATSPELQQIVQDRFATAIALAENAAFYGGTGSGQPYGFASSDITPTVLATNSTAGNLAYTDVVQQYFKTPTAYRNRAVWVTSSAGVQLLMNIKDSTGRPIYQNGAMGNGNADLTPPTLYNRPLYIVDEIPTNLGTGTNETQLWYADFKNYFIGTRGALRIEYGTNGTDFAQDKLSLRIVERIAARPFMDLSWTVKNIK